MNPKEIIQEFTKQTEDAVFLAKLVATHFHEGQMRKIEGKPYIVHPARIAKQLDNETDKCIAWLHDVVEDSEVTLDDLQGFFSEEIVQGVDCLTKVEGDTKATLDKIRHAPRNVQHIKLLDVLDYWLHCKGMSATSITKHAKKAKEFYLPLAEDNGENDLAEKIRRQMQSHDTTFLHGVQQEHMKKLWDNENDKHGDTL